MENNEIPPYDIPFGNDDNGINMDNMPQNLPQNTPADSNMYGNPQMGEENINLNNELLNDDFQPQIPTSDEIPNADDMPAFDDSSVPAGDETVAEQHGTFPPKYTQSEPKKGGGISILVLLAVVFILFTILAGAMVFLYADNIPFLSKNKNNTENIETMELNDNLSQELDSLPQEDMAQEGDIATGGEAAEDTEGTGIEITRGGRGGRTAMNDNPEMPSRGRGIQQGNENMPPLPGTENNQNDPMAQKRYYTNGTIGRIDPFNPVSNAGGELFEIIVPPVDPTPDIETQALMSLRIAGIMYTPEAPSAIINIKGQDQLVRTGDKFDGFSVQRITKDKVTVKAGINVYTASVGEILNIEQVGVNSIPNLNKKFAGPYSKGKDKIIEINMID